MIKPAADDRRFKDSLWDESYVFDFIKQSYLLTARWLQSTVRQVEGLDDKTARKVDFYTRQFVDAMAPSNFAVTNPEVIRSTLESGGENLLKGLSNLLSDLERGKGKLAIKMTDLNAFRVGENIAVTPGKVVFQNELMQLLQYTPTTETVHEAAAADHAAVDQQVSTSWICARRTRSSNGRSARATRCSWSPGSTPTRLSRSRSFDDYMIEGPLAALDAIEAATGEREVNVIGYCLGGTLLAATLAYMAERKRQPLRQRDVLHHAGGFRRTGRALRVHRRGAARGARREA